MIYPALRQQIQGLSTRAAVEQILNFVQTAFVYEYDDKVWGGDRAFFPEETLFYPYADCEDRSILFSRIVRDLLNLPVVLIYYPGHLATAVAFPGVEQGDYISLNGKRFTICDPTPHPIAPCLILKQTSRYTDIMHWRHSTASIDLAIR
jgi:hypothetical protein